MLPPTKPIACPTIEIEAPERDIPLAAMSRLPDFPDIPGDMGTLSGDNQAAVMVQRWIQSGEIYAMCSTSRQALIDWINKEAVQETE